MLNAVIIDEKELRKAWLKRKFGSWEYHEELLKLHDEYLSALHRHWARSDIQNNFPDFYETMQRPVFWNFDKIQKPGEIPKHLWKAGKESGWANAISYNFSRGLGDFGPPFTEYAGMPDDKIQHLNKLVGLMLHHCTNITLNTDNRWEDDILVEEFTGPIDWPPNWRDDIARELGVVNTAPFVTRCEANRPCPQSGYWSTLAKLGSRRYFNQGEIMPDFPGSSYGVTIWMWDQNQSV